MKGTSLVGRIRRIEGRTGRRSGRRPLRTTALAVATSAISLGALVGAASPASAAPPGSTIVTQKYGQTCNLWVTSSLGWYHGSPSCYNPGPAKAKWYVVVTCKNSDGTPGSVATSALVTQYGGGWSSTSAGWCWYGVRSMDIVELW
jgi:hypothetical protein